MKEKRRKHLRLKSLPLLWHGLWTGGWKITLWPKVEAHAGQGMEQAIEADIKAVADDVWHASRKTCVLQGSSLPAKQEHAMETLSPVRKNRRVAAWIPWNFPTTG